MRREPNEYGGEDQRSPDRWRFKREVSWGDLGLGATFLIAALSWGLSIDKRISAIEERVAVAQAMQARIDERQDQLVRESVARIEVGIRDLQQWMISRKD